MSDDQKPQPQKLKPVQPAKPSESPGTPIQKGPLPVKPVRPSKSPGTKMPFTEPKSDKNYRRNG